LLFDEIEGDVDRGVDTASFFSNSTSLKWVLSSRERAVDAGELSRVCGVSDGVGIEL
jgi:hypothetical protein